MKPERSISTSYYSTNYQYTYVNKDEGKFETILYFSADTILKFHSYFSSVHISF